jgi:hypothetical protein
MHKWLVTHLRLDEYMVQNVEFQSYMSYDTNPKHGEQAFGKWEVAKEWRIKVVVGPNICR